MNNSTIPSAMAIINELVERRHAALNHFQSGRSMVKIIVYATKVELVCIYKKHDRKTITIESTKGTLDWMFRGKNILLCGADQTPEEKTFDLGEIQIKNA